MSEYEQRSNYISNQERERQDNADDCLHLNPWVAQTIAYEIIQNFMIENDPKKMGYTFDQKYNSDKTKSTIHLEIAYDWRADVANKRPGIFISRGDAQIGNMTFSSVIGLNPSESEEFKMSQVALPLTVSVVAAPVGLTEQLADYVKQPLAYYSQVIQNDFGFSRFRLVSISKPQMVQEAKENFVVELGLQVVYHDGWVVRGDDLKLKTFSALIYDNVKKKPLENQ